MENHYYANTMKILGVNVHYEVYEKDPSKPTLVLLHGFLSSTFCYRKIIPMLKNEFNLLAIDLPPFGKSEKSTRFVHSYSNMAKLVIQLVESLRIKKAFILGHSMGGQVSLVAAKERPDLFEKVILLCSSSYMKRISGTLKFGSYIPYFYLGIKHWLAKQGVLKNLYNVVYDRSLIDEEMMQGYLEPFHDNGIFRALNRMIRDHEGDLAPEELKRIEQPSLLIWGNEDKVVPVHIGERLKNDLPNSIFYSLKDTGHLVPEERPEYVTEKILDFCHAN
ncbi:alpha/beta fold hydrolase [Metabacillus niabensis]|uniref:Pimeloyl-ACP methyl ester carboxylesterase n=1 Tax=Metabacillus niabensis TaxID=324854 RepID=A0ABT9YZY4_9BACI|nr:alpha/beta hydrolase [Metabacillus niabensis]MDQ0225564.1 pimeloyl-ACP methyl ester carboxylesterase [Metabacillus niabensis]PAD67093.1 alpha/beta hydrolase [Bacillus sp. 7586-K]